MSKMPSTPPSTPTTSRRYPPSVKADHAAARKRRLAHQKKLENELGDLVKELFRGGAASENTRDTILDALADVSVVAPFDVRLSVTKDAGTE